MSQPHGHHEFTFGVLWSFNVCFLISRCSLNFKSVYFAIEMCRGEVNSFKQVYSTQYLWGMICSMCFLAVQTLFP